MSGKFEFGQGVTLQLPPYNEEDPVLWFYLLEILFRRAAIDTSIDKYELTILLLASDKSFSLLHEIRDIIFEQASSTVSRPYETLKSTIIKRTLEPEHLKLVKEMEKGNLQPTKYLQRIKYMFGHPWNTDIDLKEIFTPNLPSPLSKLVKIIGQEESLEIIAASLDSVFKSVMQPSKSKSLEESSKHQVSAKGEECKTTNAETKRKIKKKRKKSSQQSSKLPSVFPRPIKTTMPLTDEKVHWYNLKEKRVNYKSYSRYECPSFIGSFRVS